MPPLLVSRRVLLLAAAGAQQQPPSPAERASTATAVDSPLVARLLEATAANKAANNAARAASYDRRNFADYMGFEVGVSGSMRGVKPETRAAIEAWMKKNGVPQ